MASNIELKWLANPLSEQESYKIETLFAELFVGFPVGLKANAFDDEVKRRISSFFGDNKLFADVRVSSSFGLNIDIIIKLGEINFAIEIEKTEVKRVPHDMLKIARFQKDNKNTVGIIMCPRKYVTKNKTYSRTFEKEADVMMQLIKEAIGWNNDPLGLIIYDFDCGFKNEKNNNIDERGV